MIPSIVDFQPENLYRAHEELVRNLLPQAWWSKMLPREITAWADLFARGGMAVYDETLAFELSKGPGRGECVGTFCMVKDKAFFFGADERGAWTHMLDPECRWQANRTCALFMRTCGGPVDARAAKWHRRIYTITELVTLEAKRDHAFRALLSLGRLYIPNVKESLQAPY